MDSSRNLVSIECTSIELLFNEEKNNGNLMHHNKSTLTSIWEFNLEPSRDSDSFVIVRLRPKIQRNRVPFDTIQIFCSCNVRLWEPFGRAINIIFLACSLFLWLHHAPMYFYFVFLFFSSGGIKMAFANINHLDLMSLSTVSIATVFNVKHRTGKPMDSDFWWNSGTVLCKFDGFFWSICHTKTNRMVKVLSFLNRISATTKARCWKRVWSIHLGIKSQN